MVHALANHTLGATATCILVVTGVALALIVYAAVTFTDLLAVTPAQDLLRLLN